MPVSPLHRILVLGGGSIGRRHAANLSLLGARKIAIMEPDSVKRAELGKELDIETFHDASGAISAFRPTIVFVCSPTKEHVAQALLAVRANADVFIEKPLSHAMEGIEELERAAKGRIIMIGCNMRFHPGPRKVKEWIDGGAVGRVLRARIHAASYLPDWRPRDDYHSSYSADPLQGGAILDFIHEIDLALWYCGSAKLLHAAVKTASEIGLTVDGEAVMKLGHAPGASSEISVSFLKKGYERGCAIEGTGGGITWEYGKGVRLERKDGSEMEFFSEPPQYEPNRMYLDEIAYFLECVENRSQAFSGLGEGKAALTIALAARHFA